MKERLQMKNVLGYKQSRATNKKSLLATNTICFRLQTKKGYKHKMFWATKKEGLQVKKVSGYKRKLWATNANYGLQTQTHRLQMDFGPSFFFFSNKLGHCFICPLLQ
jgi:hypothetical protein